MEKLTWPPIEWLWRQHAINQAWYSGDVERLSKQCGDFWRGRRKNKLHVPIARELAALVAAMTFAGSPVISHEDEKTDARLQRILNENALYQKLLSAAEMQSALGGVFLKVNWDTSLADRPVLTVVPADAGLPVYRQGVLVRCDFWTTARIDENDGSIWRLREMYMPDGSIESTLFRGDAANIGRAAAIDAILETQGIPERATSGTDMLLATYIPGKLPNKQHLESPYGASDYDGLYGLFGALDETYTTMMRDIRLGKTRVIVPTDYLKRKDIFDAEIERDGSKWFFDADDEVFTALDINPQDTGSGSITPVQPLLRTDEYVTAIEDIVRKIYSMAGLSPQSGGMDIEGRAESGTALNVRERRSMQTVEAKKAFWWHGLRDIARALLAVDRTVFRNPNADGDISVEFADGNQPDMATVSETIERLDRAGAASTETKVIMAHPDWDEKMVQTEVALIQRERGAITDEEDVNQGDLESDLQ